MSEGDEAVALTTEEIDARLAGIDLPEGEPQYKFFKPTADAVAAKYFVKFVAIRKVEVKYIWANEYLRCILIEIIVFFNNK